MTTGEKAVADELRCEKLVRKSESKTPQGKPIFHNERCGLPASEVTIKGMMASAKAILCERHRVAPERDSFVSERGWPLGKVKPSEKNKGYKQTRIELP